MINVTKSMRAPDDQHPDRPLCMESGAYRKAGCRLFVELKSPTVTLGPSMLSVCPRGELCVAASWLYVHERCHVNSYEHNALDFWKRTTCQDPQCVNNQISF